MNYYDSSQLTAKKVISSMEDFSLMLGDEKPAQSTSRGFAPGLGMSTEHTQMEGQLQKLGEGIFQVLFTGGFSAGKSTLLNALMHRKILQTSINAETAVITKITYEAPTEQVKVIHKQPDEKGNPLVEILEIDEFFEKYRVDQENSRAFVGIDHVILQLAQAGVAGKMVQLVDSPGTDNSKEDTEAARNFARNASAIVYLVNATKPFEEEEKSYIAKHFANNHMKNLFFVINRVDSVNDAELDDLKKNVRLQLDRVFTDKRGQFDEKLFRERVFYTNAYGSLCSRIGEPVKVMGMTVQFDDDESGVPEFETALARFLTSENRDKDALAAYIPQMKSIYYAAERKVAEKNKELQRGKEVAAAESKALADSIEKFQLISEQINASCQRTVQNLLRDASQEYSNMVNYVDDHWEEHFSQLLESGELKFGFGKTLQMVWETLRKKVSSDEAASDKRIQEVVAPLNDAIKEYVEKDCFPRISKAMPVKIESVITALEADLKLQQAQLKMLGESTNINFDDVFTSVIPTVTSGGLDQFGVEHSDANLFQAFLAIIGLDLDSLGRAASGKDSNVQAFMNFLTKNVFEYVAWSVVAWPIGLAMLAKRLYDMIKGTKSAGPGMAKEMIMGMRPAVISSLRTDGLNDYKMELENQLGQKILKAGSILTDAITAKVNDKKKSLDDTVTKLTEKTNAAQLEGDRMQNILEAMKEDLRIIGACTGVDVKF